MITTTLISKSLANILQNVMPNLVSANQSAYVSNRFISKNGRLNTGTLQIYGLLMTIDIEKAFDSANHFFLIFVLKRCGLGDDFIKWIKTLLKNQESCVLNGGKSTLYFKLEGGT